MSAAEYGARVQARVAVAYELLALTAVARVRVPSTGVPLGSG
jgi:hypothetical protein